MALQICSILTFPKTERPIFCCFHLLSLTSLTFYVHQVHLLGVALRLASFLYFLRWRQQCLPSAGSHWMLCTAAINRKASCVLFLHPLPGRYTEWIKTVRKVLECWTWVAFLPHINTCILILHLSPGSTVASSTSCLLLALVFYANKEERQGWGLFLLICPRGSLGIRINLQISGPVLLAWAVFANLFLLDGGAWRCLMSRLGLYLSTREYAGLLPDCGGSRGCFFFFFGRGTGSLWVLFFSLKSVCTLTGSPRRTPPTLAELSLVTISPHVASSSSWDYCPQKYLLECSFVILFRMASEQLKCKHFLFFL